MIDLGDFINKSYYTLRRTRTRLGDKTDCKPNPLVEIGEKPILRGIIKYLTFYGYKEFILSLGYKGDVLRNYFVNYYKYNSDFTTDLSNKGNVKVNNNIKDD